jgi:hypothetical protein
MKMKTKKEESVVGDVLQRQAESLSADAVQHGLRIDPMTAKRSIKAGIDYVAARKQQFANLFPEARLDEVTGLPVICDRFAVMNRSVVASRANRPASPVRPLVENGLVWRRKLLPLAEALVSTGQLDAAAVSAIRAGAGSLDAMTDVVNLTVLLTPHRDFIELACGAGALTKAKTTAEAALSVMGADTTPDNQAADLRDRYATLISRGHDWLRLVVARLSGSYREAAEIVGPLVKHRHRRTTQTPAVTPS